MNEQLNKYIADARAIGTSDADISKALQDAGWDKGNVDMALGTFLPHEIPPMAPQVNKADSLTNKYALGSLILISSYLYFTGISLANFALIFSPYSIVVIPLALLFGFLFFYPIFRYYFVKQVSYWTSVSVAVMAIYGLVSLLLVGVQVVSHSKAAGIPPDLSFAYSLMFALGAVSLHFAGTTGILVGILFSKRRQSKLLQSNELTKGSKIFFWLIVAVSLGFLMYFSSVVPKINSFFHLSDSLCGFGLSTSVKGQCSGTIIDNRLKGEGAYVEIETSYADISNVFEYNGKPIFIADRSSLLTPVTEKKRLVSINGIEEPYQMSYPGFIAVVNNKIAYAAPKGNGNSFVVYDGKEYGKEYDTAFSPSDVNGKLAYLAKKDGHFFAVYDGKRVGGENENSGNLSAVGGSYAYTAETTDGTGKKINKVVFGEKTIYAPNSSFFLSGPIHDVGGEPSFVIGGRLYIGKKEIAPEFSKKQSILFGKNSYAFKASDNQIYFNGKIYGEAYKQVSQPYILDTGQFVYAGSNGDKSEIVVNGTIAYAVPGVVNMLSVSKGGKIAVAMATDRSNPETKGWGDVYVDGVLQKYKARNAPFGFIGEKLFYWTQVDGVNGYIYDNILFAQGRVIINYTADINGAAVFVVKMKPGSMGDNLIVFGNPSWINEFRDNIKRIGM